MKYLILLLIPVLCFAQYNIDVGGTGGNNAGAFSVGYTYVDLTNPANYTGVIDSITIKLAINATADTFWIGTGTYSGTTWTPRDYSYILVTGTAENVVPAKLASTVSVVAGDFIAGYSNATNGARSKRSTDGSGAGVKLKSGNFLITGFTSSSSLAAEQTYLYATGYTTTITAPTGLTPANAATGVSVTPTLSWNAQGDADSFYVKLSENADLSSALVDTAIAPNSLAITGLSYLTPYYWAVAAKMDYDTTWSDTLSFTTAVEATATVAGEFKNYPKPAGWKTW